MTCDHDPPRSSLLVFRESTMFVGFQELGEGKQALLGQCRRCKSTIAIEIDVARGQVVHGEIGSVPRTFAARIEFLDEMLRGPRLADGTRAAPMITRDDYARLAGLPPIEDFVDPPLPAGAEGQDVIETAEQHAERIIR